MSITYRLLGKPGKDNALMVWINSGTKQYRLLFDCGENTINGLKYSDVAGIDYLFFSHFHLDHAAGFDHFIRINYDRPGKPVHIFGPEGTVEIIHNRLKGFTWNLVKGVPGKWVVTELRKERLKTAAIYASESFSKKHYSERKFIDGKILDTGDFSVEAVLLNHIIPSAGYGITEKDSVNIDKEKLSAFNISPGPWLESVKNNSLKDNKKIILDNKEFDLGELRKKLLYTTKGESLAYITDFIYNRNNSLKAAELIKYCNTVFCESQYKHDDLKLAKKNYHLTSKQSGMLAKKAKAGKLILFHISDRYNSRDDFTAILSDAKEEFDNVFFPAEWEKEINSLSSDK